MMPGVCENMSEEDRSIVLTEDHAESSKLSQDLESMCNIADLRFAGFLFGDHSGVHAYYHQYVRGRAFTMLRQPEQRIMSGYLTTHSWPYEKFGRRPDNVSEYAQVVAGCTVKMLTRAGASGWLNNYPSLHTVCGDTTPVTSEETALAVNRLAGFAFVGILESWDLSICLLHTKFGGACASYELEEGHTTGNSTTEYDTSELYGFVDVEDRRIYNEGVRMYEQDLQKYSISMQSCSGCFAQAGAAMVALIGQPHELVG